MGESKFETDMNQSASDEMTGRTIENSVLTDLDELSQSAGISVAGLTSAALFSSYDTTPPTVPQQGFSEVSADNFVNFKWNDSTDNQGVVKYEIRISSDSTFKYSKSFTSPDSDITSEFKFDKGTYYWQVRAMDSEGNYSGWSAAQTVEVKNELPLTYQDLVPPVKDEYGFIGGIYVQINERASRITVNDSHISVNRYGKVMNSSVSADGIIYVYAQGEADTITINSNGIMILGRSGHFPDYYPSAEFSEFPMAYSWNTTIHSGGLQVVEVGYTYDTVINAGGTQVLSDCVYQWLPIHGEISVCCNWKNSIAFNTQINGGIQSVYLQTTFDTVINENGLQDVNGGTANRSVINSGAQMKVSGYTYEAYEYGKDFFYNRFDYQSLSFGYANDTVVNSGGKFYLNDNAFASNTNVNAGALMYVSSGGKAENTTIAVNGAMFVQGGGEAENTVINGGMLHVATGGIVSNVTINSGKLYLYGGAILNGTINVNGSMVLDDVTLNNGTVNLQLASASNETLMIDNLSRLQGGCLTVDTDSSQAFGTYLLAGHAANYTDSITVSAGGAAIGDLTLNGGAVVSNKRSYELALNKKSELVLEISDDSLADAPAGTAVSVKKYDVTFSWMKYSAAKGVKVSYEIMVDGNSIKSTSNKYTLKKADVGTHAFSVRAILQEKGKENVITAWSDEVTEYVADITDPKTGKLSMVQTAEDTIRLSWTGATDNVGINHYVVTCGNETRTLSADFLSTEFSGMAGKTTASIIAYDAAGNDGKIVKTTLNMKDFTPPDQVTGLTSAGVNNKSGGILTWNAASDNVAVTQYEVVLNGKTYKSNKNYLKISKQTAGLQTYQVYAVDKAKNRSIISETGTFEVADVIDPKIKKFSGKVTYQTVLFNWNATDESGAIAKSELWLDGSIAADTTGMNAFELTNLSLGKHTVELKIWDAAGNDAVKKMTCSIKQEDPIALPQAYASVSAASLTVFSNESEYKAGILAAI